MNMMMLWCPWKLIKAVSISQNAVTAQCLLVTLFSFKKYLEDIEQFVGSSWIVAVSHGDGRYNMLRDTEFVSLSVTCSEEVDLLEENTRTHMTITRWKLAMQRESRWSWRNSKVMSESKNHASDDKRRHCILPLATCPTHLVSINFERVSASTMWEVYRVYHRYGRLPPCRVRVAFCCLVALIHHTLHTPFLAYAKLCMFIPPKIDSCC